MSTSGFVGVCSLLLPNNLSQLKKSQSCWYAQPVFFGYLGSFSRKKTITVSLRFYFCLTSVLLSKMLIEQYFKINVIPYTVRIQTASKTGISHSHMHRGEFVH